MFSARRALLAPKDAGRAATTAPVLSPAVVRSLYRRLFRAVSRLESNPTAKILFPCTSELQAVVGVPRPLYVPGSMNYLDVLRREFRDVKKAPNVKLAFDTLNRLRAHEENIKDRLPDITKGHDALLRSLTVEAARNAELFRAVPKSMTSHSGPRYVPAGPNSPAKVVLRSRGQVEVDVGTVLLAHPLSSTHVDRRVMIITERTPVMTSGVVLDLPFIFPVSRGNPMFPEIFWGHEVYDGGFNQINLTMPPTAQVIVLHTLEPPAEGEDNLGVTETTSAATEDSTTSSLAHGYVSSWLTWGATSKSKKKDVATTAIPLSPAHSRSKEKKRVGKSATSRRGHELLCQPLIKGGTLPNGEKEPTLYMSKVEALPYLAKLAAGQPRSSLRIYWGGMRWSTSDIEAEVGNGHWFPVEVSPSFFRSFSVPSGENTKAQIRTRGGKQAHANGQPLFSSEADLAAARELRHKRFGADVSLPQVFPAEGAIRRRECLWDEMMYVLGGEYAALVGMFNPFLISSAQRNAPQILAPLPLQPSHEEDTAIPAPDFTTTSGSEDSQPSDSTPRLGEPSTESPSGKPGSSISTDTTTPPVDTAGEKAGDNLHQKTQDDKDDKKDS